MTLASIPQACFISLPDELIDNICRHAREIPTLPAYETRSTWFWEPSSRYVLEMRFPSPTNFVALRLVSQRLYQIATPYLWETLDIHLQHQVEYQASLRGSNSISRGVLDLKRSRNSIHILDYVASRPLLASMVRILCLRVSGYTFTALSRGETESNLENCIERLLSRTTALTTFCIDNADLLTPLSASRIISSRTLRLVDLRTVGFRGSGLQMLSDENLRSVEWFGLSVFNLAYKSLKLPKGLKKVSLHCDSMSTFVRNEEVVMNSHICVDTMEELAMYDKHGDVALFVSKHFLYARCRNQQVALKELFLDLEWCYTSRLKEILSNLQGSTIKKLTIRNLHRLDPQGLFDIIGYFPKLREFAISSSTTDIVPTWITGRFNDYVEALKGAKELQSLEWDNSAMYFFEPDSEENLKASLAALLGLSSLTSFRLISFNSCTVTNCTIRRNENGDYEGYSASRTGVFPDFEASLGIIRTLYK